MLICDRCNKQVEPIPGQPHEEILRQYKTSFTNQHTLEVIEADLCRRCSRELYLLIEQWEKNDTNPTD